mgnify:CR=1 FL=1
MGGGGLISGVAFAIKSLKPDVKVYGVQAEGAPSMYRSLHEHKYQTLSAASTFADGIQVKTPGELTYKLCEAYVDDIVTVTEDETAAAILSLMENQKLVAEGAGAVPVAAALFHKLPIEGKKVVCVVSGGNIDVNILNRVITRGLVMSGRKANLTIALEDKPGQLKKGWPRSSPAAAATSSPSCMTAPTPTCPSPAASSSWHWRPATTPRSNRSVKSSPRRASSSSPSAFDFCSTDFPQKGSARLNRALPFRLCSVKFYVIL